jgi:hypothetical protein
MAKDKTDPTRIDDAASKTSSNWLLLEDVFQRWRARLGLGQGAVDEVYALLCDRETRSRKWRVDTNGKEIPGTLSFLNAWFWQERPCLLVVPDADGVGDRLEIDYMDYVDVYSLPNERMEFDVRRRDVERWERLYPELAAPPAPGKEPTPSEESDKPRQKPGPKPDFEWEKIEAECYDLMDYHGDFMPEDREWNCQARLEEALMKFCQDTWAHEPGPSTFREKLPEWLSTWHKR